MLSGKKLTADQVLGKINALQTLGRAADGIQVIVLGTLAQYLYAYGELQLYAPHWRRFTETLGGRHQVGVSLGIIALIGLIGIFSLAVTQTDRAYTVIMWVFTLLAVSWFMATAAFQTYSLIHDHAGNLGLWSWGIAAMFFLFSRIAITLSSGLGSLKEDLA